ARGPAIRRPRLPLRPAGKPPRNDRGAVARASARVPPNTAKEGPDKGRHPREGGDPASSRRSKAKTLDSRLRGNDGQGGEREDLPRYQPVSTSRFLHPSPILGPAPMSTSQNRRFNVAVVGATGAVGET